MPYSDPSEASEKTPRRLLQPRACQPMFAKHRFSSFGVSSQRRRVLKWGSSPLLEGSPKVRGVSLGAGVVGGGPLDCWYEAWGPQGGVGPGGSMHESLQNRQ